MSDAQQNKKQEKKDAVFQTRNSISTGKLNELNAPQDWMAIQRSNSIGGISHNQIDKYSENASKERIKANKEYLKQIVESANNAKLAKRVKDQLEADHPGNEWTEARHVVFHRQYPKAKKDRFFGSSENAKIKEAKKIFRNADLNTVREKPALDQFFADKRFTDGPVGENAEDEIYNNDLQQYVDYLMTASLDSLSLTDDYLSEHIAEVYEFSWKLSQYQELKQKYPVFFTNIPETKKIMIERMYASSKDLSSLLENHLRLHGIVITEDENEDGTFTTRTDYRIEVSNKTERHEKRRQLKEAYDRQYNDFMQKAFLNKEYELARQFSKNKFVNESKDLYDELTRQFPEDSLSRKLFNRQVSFALEEIEKTLSLRDQLVAEQNTNVDKMDNDNGEEAGYIRTAIKRTNDKLILCTEHIDNYKQYLLFLNGSIDVLPKEVTDFLNRSKQDELLEPVRLKTQAWTTEREERNVYQTDIDDIMRRHDRMDSETAKRAALMDKRISYNEERILESDRLYDALARVEDKRIDKLSVETLGRIKAYTNRLLSLKFNNETLTEDYIAEHMDEFYEYSRAYHMLDMISEELPETLIFLNDTEKRTVEGRKGYISEVDGLIKLVMKKHGMYMIGFEKGSTREHWNGFMTDYNSEIPTEEEKARIQKDIDQLTEKLKAIDAENIENAEKNLVTNKVAGDIRKESFVTNKVAGDIREERFAANKVAGDEIFKNETVKAENLAKSKVAGDSIFREEKETANTENLITNKAAVDAVSGKDQTEDKVNKLESDFEKQIKEINLNFKSDSLTASSENYEDYAEEIRELLIKKERMYRHFLKGDELKRKISENRGRMESLKTGPLQAMPETVVETTAKKKEYTPKVTEEEKKGAAFGLSAYPELDEKNKAKIPLDPNKLEEYLGEDVITDELEAQYAEFTTFKLPVLKGLPADPKEKAELKKTIRDHLLLEQGALIDDRRMRTKKAAPGMNEKYVEDLTQAELYGKYGAKAEYKKVLREVLFRKDAFDGKYKAADNIWMINELGRVVKENVIKPLESLDLKTFIIADDAQFVAGFGTRYDMLTKIEAYETLLDMHDEESAVISGGENKCVARAKLAILKQIKQSYEERMKLISSPYYTALSTEYLESFMGAEGAVKLKDEGLDASLKEYIQLYRKVRGDKTTSKVIDNRYNLKLNGVRKSTAGKDIGYISKKHLSGVNPEGSNEEILAEIYANHKKAEIDAFAKDDIEFLRTQEIRFASDTLGLSGNDFMKFHNDFADILTKGTFRGTRLDEKVRSKISGYIHSYIAEMKELEAAHRIRDVLTQVTVFSCGADTNNPEFANSFIGKLILRLKNCEEEENVNEKIAAERGIHLVNTFGPNGVLLTIFESLIDSGVSIGEKYAERAADPEIRKDILDTAKNADDYPPILVNGREYPTYSQPPVLMKIDGLNIKMKGADAEKLDTLVKNIEQCYRDNMVYQAVYDGGGDKAILYRIERRKNGEMIRDYTTELENLLKKYKINISGEKEVPAKYKITHEEFDRRKIRKDENKLPEGHENLDETVRNLKKADKHETLNLDQIYAAIDSEYADSGLSAQQIETIKYRQRDFFDFDESIRSNADQELIKALEKDESLDMDGIKYLLYPVVMHLVNVDDEGKELLAVDKYALLPLTKDDEINKNTNNEFLESLQSKKLSDRQEFLDYVADEAENLAFTYKQLNDPKYIVNHKEQAIRHLFFFRNLLKLYKSHAGYYLSKERADSNKMLFNLLVKTDYVNYSSYCIQRVLLGDRMRKDGTLSGTQTEGLEAPDMLVSAYSNGKNKVGNADIGDVELAALKEKYGSKKQSFTISEREDLIKSVLDDMEKEKKNKGKKTKDNIQNNKVWAEIDKYKKSLIKNGTLYNSVLENDIDLISYTGEMTYDEIREENERKEQERKEQERIEREKKRAEIKKKAQEEKQKKLVEEQKKAPKEEKKEAPMEEQKKAEEKKADAEEKKGEKKFLSADSPELIKNLEAERKLYNSVDYPEETKKRYEALLKKKKFPVPKDMADLVSIRGDHMESKFFYKRNSKGEIYEAEDFFWKEDTDPVFKEAYDWLVGYYRANMDSYKDIKPIRYNHQASAPLKGVHTPYEAQGHSLYCWACTMNGLMNEYAGHKVSDLNMVKNTPLNIPSFEESGFLDRAKYDEGVKLAKNLHEGKETGNPAIFGDYILQKLPDTAVCGAHIGIDPKRREFCKRRFLETLGTRLEKGPVGFLYAGHFVLVYAIDGDKLKVRNSSADDPDQLEDYEYDAEYIFSTNYREVELVWLENVKGREQEIAREYSLEYDEENRTFSGAVSREKETILHRNGIEGMKAPANGDLVTYQIYVPKQISGGEGPDGNG